MGKIILEFDSTEEAQEARMALDVHKYYAVLWDLDQALRSTVKYGSGILDDNEATSAEQDATDKWRDRLREIMSTYNISFE